MEIEEVCAKLRSLLKEAVSRNMSEGLLLSGGLDTSILAYLASVHNRLKALTVAFDATPAPDVEYAKLMAKGLNLEHIIHLFNEHELLNSIPMVIKTLKSFDPMEIRNSVSIFIALRLAKEKWIKSVMTGDGSDELFAGYSFLFDLKKEQLDFELRRMWESMFFSSIPLGRALSVDVKTPFLDLELKSYAMSLDPQYKIKKEGHQTLCKWILRKAFDCLLPEAIVWRVKMPIEYGSGTNLLTNLLEKRIDDFEFDEKKRRYLEEDKVTIRDKEQLWYYEIYRKIIGIPRRTKHSGKN